MTLTPITINLEDYPAEFHQFLQGASIFDSSCSPQAKVIFIDKDGGYFLKTAPKGKLERQATMTKFFHSKGLSSNVLSYISTDGDWLLTEKIPGEDCIAAKHLAEPERLVDILAERMVFLHGLDFANCPAKSHTDWLLATAKHSYENDTYDKSNFQKGDSFGYKTPEEAWAVVEKQGHLLQRNTLLHGDYCLPNIMLHNWQFSGFIDLDNSGIGDRHVDIFWVLWSLIYNLNTDKYKDRFIDAYGRNKVDENMLKIVAAIEVFG